MTCVQLTPHEQTQVRHNYFLCGPEHHCFLPCMKNIQQNTSMSDLAGILGNLPHFTPSQHLRLFSLIDKNGMQMTSIESRMWEMKKEKTSVNTGFQKTE